eukprot:39028-Eustigmatos_ZCMA.PRE.1
MSRQTRNGVMAAIAVGCKHNRIQCMNISALAVSIAAQYGFLTLQSGDAVRCNGLHKAVSSLRLRTAPDGYS